jgi:O-antigen ligase
MTANYYRRALAVAAVLVFFTNLSVYVGLAEIAPISPWHIILIFAVASAPLFFSREYLTTLRRTPVPYWCCGFVMVSAIWLLFQGSPSDGAWQEFRTRVLSVFFILTLLCIFSSDPAKLWGRRAILAAVLIAVGINVYELFHPLAFSRVLGRSAGLYVNSNQSGAALILGMIFSIGLLAQRYRLLFALIVSVGVFLTFSRGAITGLVVAVFTIIATGVISLRRSLVIGCFGLTVTVFVLMSQWDNLQYELEDLGVLNKDVVQRVEGFASIERADSDDSAAVRKEVADGAWEMFADQPIVGHGVAASKEWHYEAAPHNQYLSLMVDHGILGLFILPLLALAAVWRVRGEARQIGLAFTVFILFWGMLSHSILEEFDVLIMFSLLAAMAASSRLDQRCDQQAIAHLQLSQATSR